MSDENVDPEALEEGTDEGTVPKSELKKAIAARQKAKQKAEAEAVKNAELAAKLAEYEAKEKEAEKARLRAAEDWGTLEKQLTAERDEARATLEGERKTIRRGNLLEAVVQATGRDRTIVNALMLMASHDPQYKDLDWHPEQLTDKSVESVVKVLKKVHPDTFKDQSRGGTPGAIGQPVPLEDRDDNFYRNMGKKYSTRPSAKD